ncbi:hypothetical protein Tsubulata_027234 [Turnera subulata]|uniref:TF-B3 domain-containing protein n=1 Tax=Turnera subulata TaxID=218843 RepID=A0A9Q0F028_9ROSI|nr:hypothetical protein Tsubulata_027234 [Turnera subulata]
MRTVLFSKLVSKTDIESHLVIPDCPAGTLPSSDEGQSMEMHVLDNNGREWLFPCCITRNDLVGKFLNVGWIEFVRERDVRENDEVSIIHDEVDWKNQGAATTVLIKIEVRRKIRLFGKDIWADLK